MMRFMIFVFALLMLAPPVFAHESDEYHDNWLHEIASETPRVKITQDSQYRYITSNGIPAHTTGQFPNRANPNALSAQNHQYRMPLSPKKTSRSMPKEGVIGIALNGVPIEPGTAECYGRSRGERGPMQNCEWREEAIVNGKGQLGLDQNNAHVQPTGSYNYHGVPIPLVTKELAHIGYAADGHKIFVSQSGRYKPSYLLKVGARPSGPGGRYTGKYTADFEYKTGSGNLDQCNGAQVNGEYVYFLTEEFPFAPRCLMGQADGSFERKARRTVRGDHPPHHRGPPPSR